MAVNTHCISLNGSSQYLTAADSASLSITGAISSRLKVKINSLPTTDTVVVFFAKANWDDTNRSYSFSYYNDGGTLKLSWYTNDSGGTGRYSRVTKTLTTGVWYNLCVTNDTSGNVKFYVNGTQEGETQTTGGSSIKDTNAVLSIGENFYSGAPQQLLTGFIDEVEIWNIALTSTQVSDWNTKRIVSYPNLRLSCSLDNTLTDSSGNGNTLTNVGSATFSTDVSALTSEIKIEDSFLISGSQSTKLDNQYGAGGTVFITENDGLNHKIISARFNLLKAGTVSGNATAKLYALSAGLPTTLLATSDNYNVANLTTSYQWIDFIFSGDQQYSKSPNTQYAIVVDWQNGDENNYIQLDDGSSSSGGVGLVYVKGTSSWSSSANYRTLFYVIGEYTPAVATNSTNFFLFM